MSLDSCVLLCYLAIRFLDNFPRHHVMLQKKKKKGYYNKQIEIFSTLLHAKVCFSQNLSPVVNYSSSPSSLSSTSSSPSLGSVALFMQSSEQVQPSMQDKPLPTHEHRLVWQLLRRPQQNNSITACELAPGLSKRSQGVLPSVAIHG